MEGGRRITVSPRPCCGRRVLAKKRPRRSGGIDGFVNSVKKLQRREISSKRDRAFSMSDAQERFRNIRLQVRYRKLTYLQLSNVYSPTPELNFYFLFFLGYCQLLLGLLCYLHMFRG